VPEVTAAEFDVAEGGMRKVLPAAATAFGRERQSEADSGSFDVTDVE